MYNIQNPHSVARFIKNNAGSENPPSSVANKSETDAEKPEEVQAITLQEQQFTFDQLVLDDATLEELQHAVNFERIRDKVYRQGAWKKSNSLQNLP
jgi:predicted HTH transcriptional regulator